MNDPRKPPWFADPEYLRGELKRIATHPECPPRIYNIAADALQWARKHVRCEAREGDGITGAQCSLTEGHVGRHHVSFDAPDGQRSVGWESSREGGPQ